MGRFLQEDPVKGILRKPQFFNLYPYVSNNPTNFVDPNGEFFQSILLFCGYNPSVCAVIFAGGLTLLEELTEGQLPPDPSTGPDQFVCQLFVSAVVNAVRNLPSEEERKMMRESNKRFIEGIKNDDPSVIEFFLQ